MSRGDSVLDSSLTTDLDSQEKKLTTHTLSENRLMGSLTSLELDR